MLVIHDDNSIYLTRGDIASIQITALNSSGEEYLFKAGDIIRFSVYEKGRFDNLVLRRDAEVTTETNFVNINLSGSDTKFGELIHKPKQYWYEVELNPDTAPQTIIGYDDNGPKILTLFPEGVEPEWALNQ